MKSRIAIATLIAGLCPSMAFAAEGVEEPGSWFALIFYAINFLFFIWVIKRFGGPQISAFFRDRAKNIRETLTRADSAFKQAQELANRAAEKIAKVEAEKSQIASDLSDETVYQIGRIYDIAQETVARIKRDTAMTGTALREAAQRRMRASMTRSAGELARVIIEKNFGPADQTHLLEGFSKKLQDEARR
jgi:F0F1-type ATP synthase membrane subunit b/b'